MIGAGLSASWHVNAIKKQDPETELRVFDIDLQAGRNFSEQWEICVAETLEELYQQVEAVIICTPTFTHHDLAMEAMRRRKHRLTRAHREKQLKTSCQALHNAPPNRT